LPRPTTEKVTVVHADLAVTFQVFEFLVGTTVLVGESTISAPCFTGYTNTERMIPGTTEYMRMRRRTFLAMAAGSLAAVSGCSTGDGEETPTATPTPTTASVGTTVPVPTETATAAPTETPSGPETIVEAASALIGDMSAGRFDRAYERFESSRRDAVSPGALEAVWIAATNVGGPFEAIVDAEETVQAGFDAVDLTLGFERSEHTLRVLIGDELAVVGVAVNDEYERPGYVDRSAFAAEETTVETDGCLMDATVTLPNDGNDLPGVVLVHGSDPSGAADKNLETIGSQIFRDVAEGLSSQGVAVLRYDRRTHACPNSRSPEEYTLDAVTVDDPLVAIDQLRTVGDVDPDRVAVTGLSLGALAVPRIARRDGNLAGGVAMAAPARSFHEIFIDQYEHLATVGEYEWDQMDTLYDRWRDRIDRIRQGDYAEGDIVLGYPGALWNSVDAYDHVGTARAIDTPLLFLQGDRDYQVSAEKDFEQWQTELAGRSGTEFRRYDGLNHVFQFGTGPSVPGEYAFRNSVDQQVVTDIADWLTSR
jgi:fermentation-respiration switch protein FrsA (DUF1100 family)